MRSLIAAALLVAALTGETVAGTAVTMARPQVNIRADATVRSARIAVLRDGDQVELLGRKDEWLQIRLADGRPGWVHSELARAVLVVSGDDVRIRAAGSTSARVVAVGRRGDELERLGQAGRWVNVELPDGEQGWIWSRLVAAKEVDTYTQPAASASPPPVDSPVDLSATEEAPTPAERVPQRAPPVRTHPFVQGLQQELEGEHARALAHYLQVTEDDPRYIKAQLHAATAQKRLGNFGQARRLLDRALALGAKPRTVYADLAELHRLSGQPDSAAKYRSLAAGQPWEPGDPAAPSRSGAPEPEPTRPPLLLYAAGGLGLAVLTALVALLLVWYRARRSGQPHGRFNDALRDSRQRLQLGAGEADELDRKIADKRRELRASAAVFPDPGGGGDRDGGQESAELDQLVAQLDVLRRGLEMQDEREQAYADLVRLQNMKIGALEEELELRRAQPRRE
jgi:uncharacterized protein YgiM (DUF1202 family)/tetratricopeptide (TPR) repeat protein